MKLTITLIFVTAIQSAFAQWTGQTNSSDVTSQIYRTGVISIDTYNTAQIRLNSSGTYYGKIGNPSPQVWSLGWGGATSDINPVLNWTASGNVGIGTTTPVNILDVNGVARFRRQGSATDGFTLGGDALSLQGWAANNPYIEWRNSTGIRQGYMGWNTNRLSLVLENSYNFTVENGNVGIGTTSPVARLEVNGDTNIGSDVGTITGYGAKLNLLGASSNGDALWFSRYNNGANQSELRVNIGDDVGQAQDMFVVGTHFWNGGAWYPHFAVQASGNVGIGTTTPDAKLAVKGQIHAQEVKVDLLGSITPPDYVFSNNYQLPTLDYIKTYIDQNKHLPEVPSAKEMETNGVNLGEMNMLLLKKIEELTLYVIELKKEIEVLKDQK